MSHILLNGGSRCFRISWHTKLRLPSSNLRIALTEVTAATIIITMLRNTLILCIYSGNPLRSGETPESSVVER
jgi:hypothetical protein